MNTKTRKLTATALMIAATFVLGFTVGFIPVPIGPFKITLMCLPVIIGTLMIGWQQGLILGAIFALCSLYQGLVDPIAAALIAKYPLAMLPSIFIPRLLIPLTTWGVYLLLKKLPKAIGFGISSAVGSLTNTILFLGMIYVLGGPSLSTTMGTILTATLALNGLLEMLAAVFFCTAIMLVLNLVYKRD